MSKKKIRFSEIYNSFSEIEKKEFMEFISISLFNKGRNYQKFLQNLKIDENGIYNLNVLLKDRTLHNRLSELTILAEKFLIIKNLDKNKFTSDTLLLDELYIRKIDRFYLQRFSSLNKRTLQKKTSFEKIKELYEINLLKKENDVDTENSLETIDAYRQNIDYRLIQFVIEILDYMINELFFKSPEQNYRNEIFGKLDFNFMLSYFKKNLPEYYSLVSFYYYIYKSFLNTDDTYNYYIARKILTNDLKNISKGLKTVLNQYMIVYNISKINKSKQAGNKEIFYFANLIYKDGLPDKKIMRGFHNSVFVDYTMNALALKKFKWAEKFINKYGELLQGKNKEDAVFLCKAFLEYYRKNFKLCKELADNVKKINPYYYIHATKLILQSSFELNDLEECHLVLRRLQEYIRVKKKADKHLIEFTHKFCLSFALLLRLKESPFKKNYINLEYDLDDGNIEGRKWIDRKMKEIKVQI